MKIGIFDSGLGGLLVTKKLIRELPEYDYIYLGDTKRLPYGNRSAETVYEFLKEALDFLYKKNCKLVIVACNTASAEGIDRIKREYLPRHWPDRKILGVVIPTIERVLENKNLRKVGVLATSGTVGSKKYVTEFHKLNKQVKVYQQAAPLLVPMIENNGLKWVRPILKEYLSPLLKHKVDAIVLGCTHYTILKNMIRELAGPKTVIFSQDELITEKLEKYLHEKLEIKNKLHKRGRREFLVTDITDSFKKRAKEWFGSRIRLKLVHI
jgi:glutamate racemase